MNLFSARLRLLSPDLPNPILMATTRRFPLASRRDTDALELTKNDLPHPVVKRSMFPNSFSHELLVDGKVHGIDSVFGFSSHEGKVSITLWVPFWEA